MNIGGPVQHRAAFLGPHHRRLVGARIGSSWDGHCDREFCRCQWRRLRPRPHGLPVLGTPVPLPPPGVRGGVRARVAGCGHAKIGHRPEPAQIRSGREATVAGHGAVFTRPKSRIMRVTRQLALPPRSLNLNLATLEYSTRRSGRATQKSECAMFCDMKRVKLERVAATWEACACSLCLSCHRRHAIPLEFKLPFQIELAEAISRRTLRDYSRKLIQAPAMPF